jgi:hypothetical protein
MTNPAYGSESQSGRGPTGKLRNFAAMKRDKLQLVIDDIRAEGNDPEALSAAEAAWEAGR